MGTPKRIVYVLKNADKPPRYYTGVTADLKARLAAHNAGRCPYTSKHRPWAVDAIVKFADEARAQRLERYLKRIGREEQFDQDGGHRLRVLPNKPPFAQAPFAFPVFGQNRVERHRLQTGQYRA